MMGFDIVGMMNSSYGVLLLLLLLLAVVLWRSGFFRRLIRVVEEMMFSNWQLALLGATAVALSLASGYTTFDGLRNFTSAPLLSVLIAFGIQGVMLIVAWLIGESFATGMNQRLPRGERLRGHEAVIGMGLGLALVGLVFYWLLSQYGAIGFTASAGADRTFRTDWQRVADVALYFVMALVLVALIALSFRRGGDIARPYVQSVRLIAKNVMLWVMFLASMSASVFFSFDSHFNAIFPAEQRARAAEIRTLNQVAGVVADIGERAQKVLIAEAERLFDTEGWKTYDAVLSKLALVARSAQPEIEAFVVEKLEERQRGIGEQQERIAGAERSQTALLRKRDELEAELLRVEPTIGALEAELAKAQTTYNETKQAITAKRIDASAEDGGVEGTLKPGKGPVWRQRIAELEDLQRKLKITDEPRLKEAQRQRDLASARIVSLKREIATIAGEVAKYKGQISAAEHRIKTARAQDGETEAGRIDPARVLLAFERARAAFRQQPDTDKLAALQAQCGNLVGAMSGAPATKEKVRGIDCDPKHAAEAAARVFALNAGLTTFQANCAGGARLPQGATTDELLAFGRKCLQDSGLVTKEATDLGARLQSIEMNRDDKAHRFVVTWNAFLDGNRLGYLALVLAIGVDGLVFMAGLFGAAAVKSPLSDVPSPKARSAEQLEAIVKNALGEDRLTNAELVLAAMKPMRGDADHRSEVDLTRYDADTAERIRKVLVAGRSIGAVERAPDAHEDRYFVRSELFEYLSVVANTARESDRERFSDRTRLVQIVGVALEPNRRHNAGIVLSHVHPSSSRHGFMGKVDLAAVPQEHRQLVQTVLNAGMAHNAVVHAGGRGVGRLGRLTRSGGRSHAPETSFLISGDLFGALLLHRAMDPNGRAADRLGQRRPHALIGDRAGNGPQRLTHLQTLEPSLPEGGLRSEIWNELLGAIGLDFAAAARLNDPTVREHALAVRQAVHRLSQGNESLRGYLGEIESAKAEAVRDAYDGLRLRLHGNLEGLAVFEEVEGELRGMLKALLLLPEVGVLPELIERLESAAQSDDGSLPVEQNLLELLRSLEIAIRTIDRGSADGWKRVAKLIDGQDPDGRILH